MLPQRAALLSMRTIYSWLVYGYYERLFLEEEEAVVDTADLGDDSRDDDDDIPPSAHVAVA